MSRGGLGVNDNTPAAPGLGADFWRFFAGQTISNLGSSVTLFALPLLVYDLTGSALNLGITTAATFLPFLLVGLPIGALVDRVDRKRLMIAVDVLRALVIVATPPLAFVDALRVEWVYLADFVNSALTIAFDSAEFAAIPSLVGGGDLIAANGRIQASYATAQIVGPLLAGGPAGIVAIETVLLIDAASFLASAVALAAVRRRFNAVEGERRPTGGIRQDVVAGLRYVFGHPVLRAISLMMALINFVGITVYAQRVLFAKFNTGGLRQTIVPNHLLGRIMSIAMVLASAASPLGALLSGWAIERTGDVALVYAAIGVTICLIAGAFWRFSPLGHAEDYLAPSDSDTTGSGVADSPAKSARIPSPA